jgi:NADH-quinone oxidoreductase subunit I
MKRKEEMTWWERLYVPEVLRGLTVTLYHFGRNLSLHVLHSLGFAQETKAAYSTQYPEERKRYPDTYRGSHRLTLKEDGSVRCTACFLCATACPANCIHIEAGEHPDPNVEKYPARYEIDTLRCIYCGMCVEACPCDAIRMTLRSSSYLGFRSRRFYRTQKYPDGTIRVLAEVGGIL